MSHYYSEKTDAKSCEQQIKINFMGKEYSFTTDNGVFCKDYLDFGTRVMLEHAVIYGNDILDLGCGYGPVGVILGVNNPDALITMVDINIRATDLAKKNAKLNNVNAEVINSSILEGVTKMFSCILTNPPIRAGKQTVFAFYEQSHSHLIENGLLYVVIQKKQGAQSSINYLTELFGNCSVIWKEKGYLILKCTK